MAATSFGEHVRNLRKAKGISLRQAATELDVSPSYLSKIEQNQVLPPKGQIIHKLARLLEVSPEDLATKATSRRNVHTAQKLGAPAELYALYRVVQDIDDLEIVRALLRQAYKELKRPEEQVEVDLERLRSELPELPRLSRMGESLLADPCKPRFLRKELIEEMAEEALRKYAGCLGVFTPPAPVEELIEALPDTDLILTDEWDPKEEDREPTVLGVSRFSRENLHRKEIVVSARLFESDAPHMRARLNFTLAHEMFHAIEHLEIAKPGAEISLRRQITLPPQIDKQTLRPSVRQRRLRMWVENDNGPRRLTTDEDWREWQANYFAACLLMPREHLTREFEERFECASLETPDGMNVREYALETATTNITPFYVCDKNLSSLFAVSGQAMAIRLIQIGLVE